MEKKPMTVSEMARLGGLKSRRKLTPEQARQMQLKSTEARKRKNEQSK